MSSCSFTPNLKAIQERTRADGSEVERVPRVNVGAAATCPPKYGEGQKATLPCIGPAQYKVWRSFKRLLSPHSRDFFRGSLSRRTAGSEINNTSFDLAVVILGVYGSVLNRDLDNANFDPFHTHDLIREFHATLCLAAHKLLETGVLNMVSAMPMTWPTSFP